MTPRIALALLLHVALVARPVYAGDGAAGTTHADKPGEKPAEPAPDPDAGHFKGPASRTLSKPVIAPAASDTAAPRGKKAAKGKAYDYDRSKYKAYRVLTNEDKPYRFDEQGNPVASPAKKGAKKKAASSAEDAEPANCEAEQTCSYQKDLGAKR